MLKKFFGALSVVVLIALLCFALGGCGKEKAKQDLSDVELTYWGSLNPSVGLSYSSLGETPMAKNIERLTGIKVKYIHPSGGSTDEQFNLLLNSSQMPDIIEYNWGTAFVGGPDAAIDEGIILSLNDLIDNSAPNLKKYLAENPVVDKVIKTDKQKYYMFPFLAEINENTYGPMVRKDWLDELGLDIPETIDDWYVMLTEFKNKKGAKAAFAGRTNGNGIMSQIFNNSAFTGAYGFMGGFYVEDGNVVYGYAKQELKQLLDTFAKWMAEGLIDPDFTSTGIKELNGFVLNGKTGATFDWLGSGMGKWTSEALKKDPNFKMVAVPYPVMNKGDKPEFGYFQSSGAGTGMAAITTSSKYPEIAAKFLDFGYSKEGMLAYNFGVEGESYNMIDGYPTYTDLILKNPDGLSVAQSMGQYIRASYSGQFIRMKEYSKQYYELQEQKDALTIWETNAYKYYLPMITFTQEEGERMASIQQNIEKYVSEYVLTVIVRNTSTSGFDDYIARLKTYGLDELLEIYNNAYRRFMSR